MKENLIQRIRQGNCKGLMCDMIINNKVVPCPLNSNMYCSMYDIRQRAIQRFVEEFGQESLFEALL